MAKVVLGLSGGVDSAVAAILLRQAGHEVLSVFLSRKSVAKTAADSADLAADFRAEESARRAAAELDIPLEVCDIGESLEKFVCREFEREWLAARTPNPCVICNPTVKFPALLAVADKLGAEFIATGHYARTDFSGGMHRLKKGLADGKINERDQSYMLCRLDNYPLSRIIFPLGELSKPAIRALAAQHNISAASSPDSMEICFIPDSDYAAWLERRGAVAAHGSFVDEAGNILGTHEGYFKYTVGKRRGLNLAVGERLFVKAVNPNTNSITLAKINNMYCSSVNLKDFRWVSVPPKNGSFELYAKLRHSKTDIDCTAEVLGRTAVLRFLEPVRLPAPGQFAALYEGDVLVASGRITN